MKRIFLCAVYKGENLFYGKDFKITSHLVNKGKDGQAKASFHRSFISLAVVLQGNQPQQIHKSKHPEA